MVLFTTPAEAQTIKQATILKVIFIVIWFELGSRVN